MDAAITQEILEELTSALQRIEARSSAMLEFVKDKGIIKEDELAPYLERANAASSVRWRASRVRLEKLLSGLEKKQQQREQRTEPHKEHEQTNEQQQQGGRRDETQRASGPTITSTPGSENEAPQSSKAEPSHHKQQALQSKPPTKAESGSASQNREHESASREVPHSEKPRSASSEQSSEKADRPDAA